MTEQQIIDETRRYINDRSYQYAILIDGEWGSGKTFFVTKKLKGEIDKSEAISERPRSVKYISLYGCKNISDIQENLVWEIADEARRSLTKKAGLSDKIQKKFGKKDEEKQNISDSVLLSTKKIGNEILKKFFPGSTVYDIAADWINLKSYIFIFDDLERCDCPLNEVFGMLNGLVEHEGTKVIIIANEKEIDTEKSDSVELQYLLALDSSIEWPKREERSNWLNRYRDKTKIRLDELEWRRSIMFPAKENLSDYKRIREKLIGVTLRYQPDMDYIIEQIIANTQLEDDKNDILMSLKKDFMGSMNYYQHHNLRTFQFFISKIDYLLTEFNKLNIDVDYKKKVSAVIVRETFRCAIEYKSNYHPINDPYSFIKREETAKSKTIKEYVEKGEFSSEKFSEDISNIVIEFKSNISADDPFNLLYNQYYFHTQKWNEEQLERMIKNLSNDRYPIGVYEKMVLTVVRLVDMGFSKKYLDEIKQYMLVNIKHRTPVKKLEVDLWYMDEGKIKDNTKSFLDEINVAVESHSEMQKRMTVNEILCKDNWMEELDLYTNSLVEGTYKDISVFSQAEADSWYDAIHRSTPEEIDEFRHWLNSIYPSTSTRNSFSEDAQVLIDLWKKLNPENEQDLIKKACTNWLKNQIQAIIKANMPERYDDIFMSEGEEN